MPEIIKDKIDIPEIVKIYPKFKFKNFKNEPLYLEIIDDLEMDKIAEISFFSESDFGFIPDIYVDDYSIEEEIELAKQIKKSNKPTITISSTEKNNPDDIRFIQSLSVLYLKLAQVEQEIEEIEGRIPKNIKKLYADLKARIYVVEKEIINFGQLSYKALLNKQIKHYLDLYKYFIKQNEQEKENLIAERLEIVRKEFEELLVL